MRTISNLVVFTMAVYVMLDIYVTAPSGLSTNTPVHARYMVASR